MSETSASFASVPGSVQGILAEAVDLSRSAIAITDPDGGLVYANPRFREVSGCPIGEPSQARPVLWRSEHMPPEVHEDLWRTLRTGNVWRGILHGQRPGGDPYLQSTVIVPIRDSAGRVLHYLQVSEDVTGLDALASTVEKSAEASAESRRRVAELERMALTDDLTGLFNRRGFEQEMRRIWALASRRQEPVSIMVIDIDNFKGVNDLRGHPVGDRAIREVALLLQREFRVSDILCRWGGDEMIAVLPFTDLRETRGIAERVLLRVRSQAFCGGATDLHITVSIGAAAALVEAGMSPESLLMQADQAMFRAKQEGRNKACFADDRDIAMAVRPADVRTGRGRGHILLVEDDPDAGRVLCRLFQAEGFDVELLANVEDTRRRIHIEPAPFDILMADLYLGSDSGIELFREVHSHDACIVGIIITGSSTVDNAIEALRAGAFDFLAKPIDLGYATAALDRAMEHRRLLVENRRYQLNLEKMVRDKSAALVHALERARSTFLFTMEALASMLDAREKCTGDHSKRVSDIARIVARAMKTPEDLVEIIRQGGLLHDIGKIAVPDAILLKEGPLSGEEWAVMRTHPDVGYSILESNPDWAGLAEIVRSHQEHYDGGGYPRGLAGEQICIGARIFSVTDAYDTIRTGRPYSRGRSPAEALAEIRAHSGTQFDPAVVAALADCQDEIERSIQWPDAGG